MRERERDSWRRSEKKVSEKGSGMRLLKGSQEGWVGGEEDTDIYPPSGRSIKIKRLVAGLKSGIQWRSWDWVSTDWNQGRGRLICKWKGVATTHCRARFLSFEALVTGERCGSAPREYSPWTLPPPCCSNGNEFWWNNFGESLEKFGRRWYEVGGEGYWKRR